MAEGSFAEYGIRAAIFLVAWIAVWSPGTAAVWCAWAIIAKCARVPIEKPLPLAAKMGGLERGLYVLGVMLDRYELIAGWLVMKAFFGWLEVRHRRWPANLNATAPENLVLTRYYGFLIGNITSLLLGVIVGLIANLVAEHASVTG